MSVNGCISPHKMLSQCITFCPPSLPTRTTIKDDHQALWSWVNPCISSAGNSVGGLRAYGPQVLHGNGPDPAGGPGPVGHRQRLVQVVPYLLSGRPQHRPAHQTPLAVLAGERHQPLMHLDNPAPTSQSPPVPSRPPYMQTRTHVL